MSDGYPRDPAVEWERAAAPAASSHQIAEELRMDPAWTTFTVSRSGRALARVARPQPRDDECVAGWGTPTIGSSSGPSPRRMQ